MAKWYDIDTDVRINGSLTLPSGSLTIGASNVMTLISGKADSTILISAGTGLSGGGDLTASRTLSISFSGTGSANTVSRSDHNHDSTYLKLSGGTLTSDLTVNTNVVVGNSLKFASNVIRAGGTNTSLVIASSGGSVYIRPDNDSSSTYEFVVGTSGITWAGNTIYHTGNFTPANKLDTTTPYVGLDTSGSTAYPRLVYKNNPGSDSTGWFRMQSDAGGLLPYSNGNSSIGTSTWNFKAVYATTLYEGNTALSSKYLGLTAKAADSDKLDNLDSSQFLRSDADTTATGIVTISKLDNGLGFKTYTRVYSVNTASPATLMDSGSSQFATNKSYRVYAYVAATGTNTGAVATFYGDGTNFTLYKHFEAGNSSNHIELYIDTNVPKMRLYSHSTLYTVYVRVEEIGNYGRAFGSDLYLFSDTNKDAYWNGNKIYTTANLPSYLGTGSNQSIGTGFTVNGTMYLGSTSAGTNNGDLVIRGTGNSTIHLDGDGSGNINSGTVKFYVNGSTGDTTASGKVTANSIAVTSTTMVANLNAEQLQGKRPYDLDVPMSNVDIGGYGVLSGLKPKQNGQQSPDNAVRIEPGVAYTSSGRRFEFTTDTTITVAASQSFDRWDIFYVRGPVNASGQTDPTNEGTIQYGQGTNNGLVPTPPAGSVVITKVLIKANTGSGTVQDGFTTAAVTPNLYDIRQWKPFIYDVNGFTMNNTVSATLYKEDGSMLQDKYARLGFDNTFTGKQLITSGKLEVRGVLNNDSSPAELFLSEFDGTGDYGFKLRYMPNTNEFRLVRDAGNNENNVMIVARDSGFTTFYGDTQINEHLTAKKNATTVTIPAGQTAVTWTHNYGVTTYAVNLTANSFERHVRWNSKAANTVSIEIDVATTQDILVDCILIGY